MAGVSSWVLFAHHPCYSFVWFVKYVKKLTNKWHLWKIPNVHTECAQFQ